MGHAGLSRSGVGRGGRRKGRKNRSGLGQKKEENGEREDRPRPTGKGNNFLY